MTHRIGWSLVVAGFIVAGAVAAPFDVELVRPSYHGELRIDGSTLVYVIADAIAGKFKDQHPRVEITLGKLSTGDGFDRFCAGETQINAASRRITDLEAGACQQNGLKYLEMIVAWDAAVLVVHKDNTWAGKLTAAQLHQIWRPEENNVKHAKKWSDLDPKWPKAELRLSGPAAPGAMAKVFARLVNGDEASLRDDYAATGGVELPAALTEDKHALALIPQALWRRHKDKVQTVAVAFEAGKHVTFTPEAVSDGSYPIRRPLYYYVNRAALKEPQVVGFLATQLNSPHLVREAGFIELSEAASKLQREELAKALRK